MSGSPGVRRSPSEATAARAEHPLGPGGVLRTLAAVPMWELRLVALRRVVRTR